MLDAVHLIPGRDDPPAVWLERVRRVVTPGGRVAVERPPADLWAALRRFELPPATDGRVDELVVGLAEAGFSSRAVPFSSAIDPEAVVWVPRARSPMMVAALLHRAPSVLWADADVRPDRVGVWVPDDPLRLPAVAMDVAARTRGCTLHVFAQPSVVDDIEEAREVLHVDEDWHIHRLDGRGPALVSALADALPASGVSVLCVGLSSEGLRAPLLSMLSGVSTDLWVVTRSPGATGSGSLETTDAVVVGPGPDAAVLRCIGPIVWTPDDADLHRVYGGQVMEAVALRQGRVAWSDPAPGVHGLSTSATAPAAGLVATVRVHDPAGPPLLLAGWPGSWLPKTDGEEVVRVAVLFQPHNPESLRDEGLFEAVFHPDSVLDRGAPTDLPDVARGVTLVRMVRRLQLAGYSVKGHVDPTSGAVVPAAGPCGCGPSLGDRLEALCGARPTRVEAVSWTLDGQDARHELLALLDGARHRIDFQVYIFEVDAVGEAVRDALKRAADRGVETRVLVDAVWSGHGAFARENPLLASLAACPGVTVASSRPVGGMVDLKARDHRKLVVVDDTVALLPGRNVGDHYYTGFSEVSLTPETDQRHVPWFDLSARMSGPVVQEAVRTFASAWAEATSTPGPEALSGLVQGDEANAWWIDHHSLRDAHGLDAFRTLLDAATQRVVLVNTFAIQHELQHALLQCLGRGVEVRIYTGHVRPRFDGGQQAFVGSAERDLATGVIHGRFEALAAAGAKVFALGVRQPHWHEALGTVLPHVHSKLWLVDDRYVVAGSHNIDIASSYWESEVVLVLDAPAEARLLGGWLTQQEELARAFDEAEGVPEWRASTRQPEWLSQHWPSLLS